MAIRKIFYVLILFLLGGCVAKTIVEDKSNISQSIIQLNDVAVCDVNTKKWYKISQYKASKLIKQSENNRILIKKIGFEGSGAYSKYLNMTTMNKQKNKNIDKASFIVGNAGDAVEFIFNDRFFSYPNSGYFSELLCEDNIKDVISINKDEVQAIFKDISVIQLSKMDANRHISVSSKKFILLNDLENDKHCCYKYSLNTKTNDFPIINTENQTQFIYGKFGQNTEGSIYIDVKPI